MPESLSLKPNNYLVFDEAGEGKAIRALWYLRKFGFQNVKVLDGGLKNVKLVEN